MLLPLPAMELFSTRIRIAYREAYPSPSSKGTQGFLSSQGIVFRRETKRKCQADVSCPLHGNSWSCQVGIASSQFSRLRNLIELLLIIEDIWNLKIPSLSSFIASNVRPMPTVNELEKALIKEVEMYLFVAGQL
jgi:hypothetical protein